MKKIILFLLIFTFQTIFSFQSIDLSKYSKNMINEGTHKYEWYKRIILNGMIKYSVYNEINSRLKENKDFHAIDISSRIRMTKKIGNNTYESFFELNRNYYIGLDKMYIESFDSLFDFVSYNFSWEFYSELKLNPNDSLVYSLMKKKGGVFDSIHHILTSKAFYSSPTRIHFVYGILAEPKFDGYNIPSVYFVSGPTFTDDIKQYVFKDTIDSNMVKDYFKIKYFDYSPKNIIMQFNPKENLYTIEFSNGFSERIYLVTLKYELANPELKEGKYNFIEEIKLIDPGSD